MSVNRDTTTFIRDATCRYARADAEHVCVRSTGQPLANTDEQCFYETAEQSRHQAKLERIQREFLAVTGLDQTYASPEEMEAEIKSGLLPACTVDEEGMA